MESMKYPKIQTIYKRDPENKYKTLLLGQYALPEFEFLAGNTWLFSEKIDGTNIRVKWDPGQCVCGLCEPLSFAGRTDRAQIPPFLRTRLKELFPTEKFKTVYPDTPMILYGEGYGAKIQKGGGLYIPDGTNFILFDVWAGDLWLKREDVEDIAVTLNISVVPLLGSGTPLDAVRRTAKGFSSRVARQEKVAEGIVMRPAVELQNRRGHRIIAKVKHKDFGGQS